MGDASGEIWGWLVTSFTSTVRPLHRSIMIMDFCRHFQRRTSMSVRQGWWMSISLGLLFVGSNVLADGHGHGLNRALSAAARSSGNSGLARAAQSTARSGNGVSQDGAR